MIELLFLLLPVAAAYGYVMGKNSAKNLAHEQNRKITSEYSKGLKFLLDREEDQGLEHLIQLLEVSADSVEHYLTLATLFRKRGELDRAIKIHELLIEQPNLETELVKSCRLELAQDYVMAGLLDSAESNLVVLVKAGFADAREPIIQLYSQTRDWEKGINMYEAYSDLFVDKNSCSAIANFYCEAALESNDVLLLDKATKLTHQAIRPLYELGLDAFNRQDNVKAIYYWRKLLSEYPQIAPLIINDLQTCYKSLNIALEYYELIEELLPSSGVTIKIKHCQGLIEAGETATAIEFLTDSLKREPSIRGFSYLLQLLSTKNVKIQDVLGEIDHLVTSYIATKPDYQCHKCGFTSHKLYWLCPSCKTWESVVPNRGLDGY
ncbi:lipopolysaccharide assembly protein LapB [Pseudoalteromonas luteoviolacea]|uniref:Lipopolysaccharide assembly protein LapB n=1 Tax=Pseudoalteromonas luteoviolacea TaxID=43657 RepID=A0A1C0TVA7_9GAMM|nr:lipopolysaccharide assembly protein LapB [Pseudoalteromonas luteoviolacea]OCQ23266.1 lipopolysaccharide assembly protein LapB [Pseudoalteromonas luteoviolacea]